MWLRNVNNTPPPKMIHCKFNDLMTTFNDFQNHCDISIYVPQFDLEPKSWLGKTIVAFGAQWSCFGNALLLLRPEGDWCPISGRKTNTFFAVCFILLTASHILGWNNDDAEHCLEPRKINGNGLIQSNHLKLRNKIYNV